MVQGDRFIANPSLAHTVGNVTFKMTNVLKNLFGPNFFKHVHIDTRMAYTDFAKFINSRKEFIKKNKPILGIRPSVDITNDDIFLSRSLFTTNTYGMSLQTASGFNMMPLFKAPDAGALSYMMNRIRVIFGCSILVDTVVEQMNIFSTLVNMLEQDRPYYYRTSIEVQIPHQLMQALSVECGIPIYDEAGSSAKFLSYVNQHTCKPVTMQEKNSTGHEEFFMYYPLNIECIYTDFSRNDPDKHGMVASSAQIDFTLTCEFNTAGLFTYTPRTNAKKLSEQINFEIDYRNQGIIVPMYTFNKLFMENDDDGWRYFTSRMYRVDESGTTDTMDLEPIFRDTNIKDLIAYHKQQGMDNHVFFNMRVYMVDKELTEGTDWKFDFDTFKLYTYKAVKDATYRFVIYVDNEYINDLLVKLHPEEFAYD